MLPLKKILCPTDFSDPSIEAMGVACELAVNFSAELIVIHVVTPIPVMSTQHMSPTSFNVAEYQEEMKKSSTQHLRELVEKRVPKAVSVRTLVVSGDPAEQIVNTAKNEGADLVVIATLGQTGMKRLVFGSVAEKVVRLAGQPVLTIRRKEAKA
jgi:nucleotide-binding universal stress UspA family protein